MTDERNSTDADLSRVRGATSVLVLAPEMAASMKRVCHALLDPERPAETGILKISYHFSPREMADRWIANNPESPTQLYCLSVTDSSVSKTPETYEENVSFGSARADDLTGIGMKLNQIVGEMSVDTSEILVCLDSLDSMLMYADRKTVYRFIRTISNFFAANDARIHFHLDPTQNEEVVNVLRSAVNAVVKVDETGVVAVKTR